MTIRSMKNRLKKFFGKTDEKWDWEHFQSTINYPVSPNLIQWIIGQEHALEETKLCVDEWIGKLKWLNEKQWWKSFENPMGNKSQRKEMLPAGPFMLLLGDAGTGKSLLGRAMQNYMTELYKKNGIILHDVIAWKNPMIASEPKISIHATPMGRNVITNENAKICKKTWFSRWGLKLFSGFMVSVGAILFGIALYSTWQFMSVGIPFPIALSQNSYLLVAGGGLMFSGIFIGIIGKMMGSFGGNNQQGIGGASTSQGPKLLIDNSSEQAPFLDATGHTSAQLFGDITWDPYQSGGLGTPEHQRVNAGDVHRAHLGIFYIDEVKNLTGPEAVTLLSVLEDGQMPITHRGHHGETGAMIVSTEPIPAMFFLIAAGNLDSLPMMHPALLDRIQGYGKMVYMSNDMPNTIENRQKYVQFISQEVKRFNLLPLSRDACIAVIEEASRRSGKNDTLTCKFRPMIGVIKTASILAKNEGTPIVERRHIDEALSKHCKSIALQVMEKHIENQIVYNVMIDPNEEPKIGQIHGLAVSTINSEGNDLVGMVLTVRASCLQKRGAKKAGYFTVTGVQTKDSSYIQHSIAKIRHIIIQLYAVDVEQDCFTHVDFAQTHGVEGPSAGITMTLALISALTQRKIRQDVAFSGEINIGSGNDNKIIITPVGGVHEKILAAQRMGFREVCIPRRNFEKNINPSNYTIKVNSCETLEDYMKIAFIKRSVKNVKKQNAESKSHSR